MNLDMRYRLVHIPFMEPASKWQTQYFVRAIELDGEAPALTALARFKAAQQAHFKKMQTGLRMAGRTPKDQFIKTDRVSVDRQNRGVYELKSLRNPPRLFFFYAELDCSYLILTHGFWKPGDSRVERERQTESFNRAAGTMEAFLRERRI